MIIHPNSNGEREAGVREAWSDAARTNSIMARRRGMQMGAVRQQRISLNQSFADKQRFRAEQMARKDRKGSSGGKNKIPEHVRMAVDKINKKQDEMALKLREMTKQKLTDTSEYEALYAAYQQLEEQKGDLLKRRAKFSAPSKKKAPKPPPVKRQDTVVPHAHNRAGLEWAPR